MASGAHLSWRARRKTPGGYRRTFQSHGLHQGTSGECIAPADWKALKTLCQFAIGWTGEMESHLKWGSILQGMSEYSQ